MIINNYKEFIKACKEYHEKAWEYAYTRDKKLKKWLDSFKADKDGTIIEYKRKDK